MQMIKISLSKSNINISRKINDTFHYRKYPVHTFIAGLYLNCNLVCVSKIKKQRVEQSSDTPYFSSLLSLFSSYLTHARAGVRKCSCKCCPDNCLWRFD